jgi:hypothetical protein
MVLLLCCHFAHLTSTSASSFRSFGVGSRAVRAKKRGLFQPAEDLVVVLVRTHPNPVKIVPKAPGNSSIGTAYGHCPDLSFGLKLEWMKGVLLEEPIFLMR